MADKPRTRTLLELAFPGDQAPPQMSVAVVSLVELCQMAMPDAHKVRDMILGAGFETGRQERADEAGRMLALDVNMVAMPVRNLRHELFGRGRHGEPVILLLSQGDTDNGRIVFLSTLFRGSLEADAIKAAAHVTKDKPFTGSQLRNHEGTIIRRVFWDVNGEAGIRGFVVTGPQNVEATDLPRAFTAFNWTR